jgi:replicative DNA helicase
MTGDLSNIIEEFKRREIPEYMLTRAAKNGYICLCGNGSGKGKGDGAKLSEDRTRLLCGLKCGKANGSYSYIDVACNYYNIDLTNFAEGVKKLARREGIDIDGYSPAASSTNAKPVAQVKPATPTADELEQKRAAADYLNVSSESLREFLNSQGGYYRGLSFYTLNFLKWKFCQDYKHPKNNFVFPAMIIPNDNGGLLARQIDGDAKSNLKPSGTSTLYFPENPEFILAVEGAINGASILQALGTELNFAIIAANGVGNKNLLVSKIFQICPNKNIPVAVAFDNDENETGQNAAADVLKSLNTAGYTACTINITKTAGKDLNDVLTQSGATMLGNLIKFAIESAKEEFDRIAAEKAAELFGESDAEIFPNEFNKSLALTSKFSDRKTGFSNLDKEMVFLPGIYVIGGLPALGKTTFALQLLEQAAQQGEHCIFCSYEMSKNFLHAKRIARRVYQLETLDGAIIDKPLTATNILTSKFYQHKNNFDKVLESLKKENIPLFIWEVDEIDIDKLLARLDKICAILDKPPIICLDYLQLLASNTEQTKAGIDCVLRKLKTFQRDTDTTFIIVSSLNRLNYNNEISFEAFKESGGIEYTADVIFGLQFLLSAEEERNTKTLEKAKKEIPRHIQLKCLKNRFGANFDIGFNYFAAVDYFKPMDEMTYLEFTETATETPNTKAKKSKSKDKDDD